MVFCRSRTELNDDGRIVTWNVVKHLPELMVGEKTGEAAMNQ